MSSGDLILVTGANGFVAGHVIARLLRDGHRVRGTLRQSAYKQFNENKIKIPNLEFALLDDLSKDSFQECLKGVSSIIHVASALPGRSNKDEVLSHSVEGTQHILKEALKANVHKIVVTGTYGNVFPYHTSSDELYDENTWKSITNDEFMKLQDKDQFEIYFAGKAIQENTVWEFAEKNPVMDISVVLPGFIYGPYAEGFSFPDEKRLGTNGYMFGLMNGAPINNNDLCFVDVRDVGNAHVLALNLPKASKDKIREKRFLIAYGNVQWKEAAAYAKAAHPNINVADEKLFKDALLVPRPRNDRSREVLGLTYTLPQKTMADVVANLLEVQASWA